MKFVAEPQGPKELPIDESIVQKVISEEWATCFMSYLIHLYREGNGWRKLTPPVEVMAYTNEYKVESDTVARFMVEFIQPLEEDVVPESVNWNTITATFQEWKRSNEVVGRAAATDLKKKLEERFGKYPRNGWTAFRFGAV